MLSPFWGGEYKSNSTAQSKTRQGTWTAIGVQTATKSGSLPLAGRLLSWQTLCGTKSVMLPSAISETNVTWSGSPQSKKNP